LHYNRRSVYYDSMTLNTLKPRRGRPPKCVSENRDTKSELIRSGLEQLTESGFTASGIDSILRKVGVPKGSFYHYFISKEAFGLAVIESYANYFSKKLDNYLLDENYTPLMRIKNFVDNAKSGLEYHQFKRGCLIGNLGQEVDLLPDSFRPILMDIFITWETQIADCLKAAQTKGEIATQADCTQLAEYFWIGWEGAVARTRLIKSNQPIDNYINHFIDGLPQPN
jgi:TetR/AcrR family transcriptional regulator, transcriptional repressor for nem operon